MSATGYKLLGYAVWHWRKWYLRRRLPSSRKVFISGLAAGAGLTAAGVAIVKLAKD
jgi:hypothetical protein